MLVVDRVRARLGGREVLRGVSLEVPAGRIAAVVGPSGCGKTTLLRCIAGFESPGEGTITVGGRVVVGAGRVPADKRRVGYVAQDGALFPHLTVGRNVGFGLPRRARSAARIGALLEAVNLDPALARRRPHELSGGQQQRVALARAMALRPEVMLLDEPFSALDTGLRARTRESIGGLLRDAGITTVLVTHDQAEALSFADQVAVMAGGVFTQVGAPSQVFTQPVDLATARFLGETVEVTGQVADGLARTPYGPVPVRGVRSGPARIVLRSGQIRLVPSERGTAVVRRIDDQGDHQHAILVPAGSVDDGAGEIEVDVPAWEAPAPGARVELAVVGHAVAYPTEPA